MRVFVKDELSVQQLNNQGALWYLRTFSVFMVIGLLIASLVKKGDIVKLTNLNHQPVLDLFFKYLTHFGDGLIFVVAAVVFLFIRYSLAIHVISIGVIHGLAISSLKNGVFYKMPRPKAYFGEDVILHFVEGVKVHSYNSFPSGHTASIFAFTFFLAIAINRKSWSVAFVGIALLVAFSRVYLVQHFFVDIVYGSIVGILSAVISVWMLEKLWNLESQPALKGALLKPPVQ
jgi:membrane-associated phospholipid phosphatase